MNAVTPVELPYDEATSRCPMSFLAECRRDMPVVKLTSAHPDNNIFLVTRAEDITRIISDAESFSSEQHPQARRWGDIDAEVAAIYRAEGWTLVNPVVWSDGANHIRYRRLVDKAFAPNRLAVRAGYIQVLIDELIDKFRGGGDVDLVEVFTNKLPALAMTREFGLPAADADLLIECNNIASQMIDVSRTDLVKNRADVLAGVRSITRLQRHIEPRIAQVQREPEDNLFSDIVRARIGEEPALNTQEILSIIPLLLMAGVHTTGGALGWSLYTLATRPDLLDRLWREPAKAPDFVEEVLRLHEPVPTTYRGVMRDVEIAGIAIPKGSVVVVRWDSINLDERKWDRPEEFDMDRPNAAGHRSFGYGKHFCIGNQLARRELVLSVKSFVDRFSGIELTVPRETVQPIPSFDAHILGALPARLTPRRTP